MHEEEDGQEEVQEGRHHGWQYPGQRCLLRTDRYMIALLPIGYNYKVAFQTPSCSYFVILFVISLWAAVFDKI